jgi:hypothetical protein
MFIKKEKITPGDLIIRNSTKKIYYVLDKKLYKSRQIILIVDDYKYPVWDFENLYSIVQKRT